MTSSAQGELRGDRVGRFYGFPFGAGVLGNSNGRWAFSKRFDIVHVDFATQKRTPKASARHYSQVTATNGAVLGDSCTRDPDG